MQCRIQRSKDHFTTNNKTVILQEPTFPAPHVGTKKNLAKKKVNLAPLGIEPKTSVLLGQRYCQLS